MINEKIMGALAGLAGAVSNNSKTDSTDDIVAAAIIKAGLELTSDEENTVIDGIHKEKNTISPDCASCLNPCGNTSDYPAEQFFDGDEETKEHKYAMIEDARRLVMNIAADASASGLPDIVYRAVSAWKYKLDVGAYDDIAAECRNLTVR